MASSTVAVSRTRAATLRVFGRKPWGYLGKVWSTKRVREMGGLLWYTVGT